MLSWIPAINQISQLTTKATDKALKHPPKQTILKYHAPTPSPADLALLVSYAHEILKTTCTERRRAYKGRKYLLMDTLDPWR